MDEIMSDFPRNQVYHNQTTKTLLKKMNGFTQNTQIIWKKLKGVYLYDLDQNKYCDFSLGKGTCFRGHNPPALTHYVKNAVSVGGDNLTATSIHFRLFKELSKSFPKYHPFLYANFGEAILSFVHHHQSKKIAVIGKELLEKVRFYIPSAVPADSNQKYDLLVYEPLDFDHDLSEVEPAISSDQLSLCIETRSFSRIYSGRLLSQNANILICDTLSNGLTSGVLLIKSENLQGTGLPTPTAMAMSENLKYFRKLQKIDIPVLNHPLISYQNGLVFKLDPQVSLSNLQSLGIYFENHTGYLSPEHSSHDLRRLHNALTTLDK